MKIVFFFVGKLSMVAVMESMREEAADHSTTFAKIGIRV
jgi:hypothetical protein